MLISAYTALYVYRVRHKFVKNSKFGFKEGIDGKIFCLCQYGQRDIGFVSCKKKVSKSDGKRMLTHYTEPFYANQAINKIPGWKWIRHSKPAVCFLY